MVAPGQVFAPDPAGVAAYRRIGRTYSRLAELSDPLFVWANGNLPPDA
jgi:hypothetical protein